MVKKETPSVIGVSRFTNQDQIIKPLLSSQVEFFVKNLDRLIEQDIYWFCKRIEAIKSRDFGRADFVEQTYLIPLQIKIKQLAERTARL